MSKMKLLNWLGMNCHHEEHVSLVNFVVLEPG